MVSMDEYPTIKRIVLHGDAIAMVIAALPLLGAVALFWLLSIHWLVLVVGAVVGVVLLFLMKSYVELVRILADMLLPK
jgi:hypothetical protein